MSLLPCTGKVSWRHPSGRVYRGYQFAVDCFTLPFDAMQLCFELGASHTRRDFAYAVLVLPNGGRLAYTERFDMREGNEPAAVLPFSYDYFPVYKARYQRFTVHVVFAAKQRYLHLIARGVTVKQREQRDDDDDKVAYELSGTGAVTAHFDAHSQMATFYPSPVRGAGAWQPFAYQATRFRRRTSTASVPLPLPQVSAPLPVPEQTTTELLQVLRDIAAAARGSG